MFGYNILASFILPVKMTYMNFTFGIETKIDCCEKSIILRIAGFGLGLHALRAGICPNLKVYLVEEKENETNL